MQCNFVSDKERMGAGSYTIQFGINLPPGSGPTKGVAYARADVTWSIAGGNVKRTIDIINGRLVSGVGEAVKVLMYDNTPSAYPGAGTPYGVFCQVTKGTRPSQNQPPTLQAFQLIQTLTAFGTAGQVIVVPVPPDAGVISVEVCGFDVTDKVEGNLRVAMVNAGGGIAKDYVSPGPDHFVPIAPGTASLTINNLNSNDVGVQVTFGIDG